MRPGETIGAALTAGTNTERLGPGRLAADARGVKHGWVIVAVALGVVSVVLVGLAGIRPAYDPYGWLVWGRQALDWSLNTDGGPSWKPLAFIFTLPYALVGRAQLWLWMVTAVALSLSGVVFAGRIAYTLTGTCGNRRSASIAAAVFAGLGLLGISSYMDFILTARSDPMIVALCLAAIDVHLSKRPRLAFVLLVLAALGRPEAWLFVGLYALWAWRAVRSMRALVAVGVAVILAAWFVIPALTSKSWFSAGELALDTAPGPHGNALVGVVLIRFVHLYAFPMELGALVAIVLAVARRDRASLVLAGAAILWVLVEIAFALHGWSGAFRYMFEPAAVMVVLAGSAVGRVLTATTRSSGVARWSGPAAVVALLAMLLPTARLRASTEHADLIYERRIAVQIDRLHAIITRDGAKQILACGQPAVTERGFQSTLAWEIGLNVANVGVIPSSSITSGDPIVLFEPHGLGWEVRPIHIVAGDRTECNRLTTNTPFG